ncbi:MAG: hypothetical protein AAF449_15490, partial [Myxococcota bacterium]
MFNAIALTAFALALPTAAQATEDTPDRLFTMHGVELRVDEDVFVLFAALNAAGYAEETERKGPPLRAPFAPSGGSFANNGQLGTIEFSDGSIMDMTGAIDFVGSVA